ncbi:alpha/beta fold hydrolase [Rothia sp. ZJ932]|uniref:alpha/beta fold hydrolase n=1 Tax=Rothia sp. ZJ932 TaxID=2810516 RepID=UPI001967B90A|nr:alpha/beta fold hydrolase [Rothia sp. ZJ932]QRZ61832.1 alpha/beta fold hydrolase [Rothia sp. ZJ932]
MSETDFQIASSTLGSGLQRVAFLHGLMGRGKNFTRIARGLGDDFTVLLMDMPNHGASGWTQDFDYARMADLVAENLRKGFAHESPVDIVGHSMGGKIAMLLALRHPELVNRLVVMDIAPNDSKGSFTVLLDSLLSLNLKTLTSRSAAGDEVSDRVPDAGVRGFLLQNLARGQDGFYWEPNLGMLRENLDAIMGWDAPDEEPFAGQVLWVAGGNSNYIQPEDTPTMRALFPKVRKITVKGAGHWVHADKPDAVIEILSVFLGK